MTNGFLAAFICNGLQNKISAIIRKHDEDLRMAWTLNHSRRTRECWTLTSQWSHHRFPVTFHDDEKSNPSSIISDRDQCRIIWSEFNTSYISYIFIGHNAIQHDVIFISVCEKAYILQKLSSSLKMANEHLENGSKIIIREACPKWGFSSFFFLIMFIFVASWGRIQMTSNVSKK